MRWPLEAVDETDAARMTRRKWLLFALELLLVIAVLVGTRVMSNQVWKLPDGDVKEYRDYALSFWTSAPYFHQLPVEYPPLAIIPFTFSVLPGWWDYHVVFAVWMGLLRPARLFGIPRLLEPGAAPSSIWPTSRLDRRLC